MGPISKNGKSRTNRERRSNILIVSTNGTNGGSIIFFTFLITMKYFFFYFFYFFIFFIFLMEGVLFKNDLLNSQYLQNYNIEFVKKCLFLYLYEVKFIFVNSIV